ncbi:TfoX/Sxy family protein [Hyalangium rubrum]|uniref:TfoX/Sxy family protein n=1 Tax=Hyalangium rubrum TaxID=3103134 RepID=A0ABU5H6G3_9BACT|nr:TfoX/Sxy family protein [Hyalangium sp. s54d21]MDY7229067.1 TfoX/Sxy family protein [Hyalangium sp. s54d21]
MPQLDSFVQYTLELLEPLGPVQARAMFGGWGVYSGGMMFGLIGNGRLYLKVDDVTRPAFEAAGCEPFVYDSGKGKPPVAMSYWTPPADASDDSHALLPWARRAVEAAQRAAAKKAPAKGKAKAKKAPAAKKTASKAAAPKKPARTAKRLKRS